MDFIDQHLDRISPEPNSGCWIWLGQVNQFGYGRVRLDDGRTQVAHRASYELSHDTRVPDHLQVDHLCRLRCCVNPDHLEVVTRIENVKRAFDRRRQDMDGFCRNGHALTTRNIRSRKNGTRISVICGTCADLAREKHRRSLKSSITGA